MPAVRGLGAIKDLQRFRSGLSTVETNETTLGTGAGSGIIHYSMLLHMSCWYRVKEGKQHTLVNADDRITELLKYSPDLGLVTGVT